VLDFATKAVCIFSPTGVPVWAIIVKSDSRFLGFVLNSKVTFTEAVRHTQCGSCLFRVLSISQLCSHELEQVEKKKSVAVTCVGSLRIILKHYTGYALLIQKFAYVLLMIFVQRSRNNLL